MYHYWYLYHICNNMSYVFCRYKFEAPIPDLDLVVFHHFYLIDPDSFFSWSVPDPSLPNRFIMRHQIIHYKLQTESESTSLDPDQQI